MHAAALAFWLGALVATAASAADPELVTKGQQVFNIGGCTNCHTAKSGELLAGGDPLESPFGAFHPPNITPDPKTGIGGWNDEQFIRAMREGISPDGAPYYPSFPYTSYTHMSDEDLRALKAYLDSVPPIEKASPDHDLGFPFNQRWGMHLWQLVFFSPGRYVSDPSQDASWNRGAYLVRGPGHCAECHVPRNFAGALQWDEGFTGNDFGGPQVRGPNITSDPQRGIGSWSEGDLRTALTIGMIPEGDFVGGEMAKIVANGTSKLPEEDLQAVVTYLRSLPPG
jgi:mono/diheme cytochrome c family protein